jgi:hypothetical protein
VKKSKKTKKKDEAQETAETALYVIAAAVEDSDGFAKVQPPDKIIAELFPGEFVEITVTEVDRKAEARKTYIREGRPIPDYLL